jgi:hypothetical protein
VTWGSGVAGISGAVSAANSLIGSAANDLIGYEGVFPLHNGNYVVCSPLWDNGTFVDAGAVTWGGPAGVKGVVSPLNSVVGSSDGDSVGNSGALGFADGNYVVSSALWNNVTTNDAGAVTLGLGETAITGAIASTNSVRGTVAAGGESMNFTYDSRFPIARLFVGYPAGNRVSIFSYIFVVLTSPRYTNGTFQFTVNGPTGVNYIISSSTNLVNWSDVSTNILPTPPFLFTEPGDPAQPRFYRARAQP